MAGEHEEITLTVKLGPTDIPVSLNADSTIMQLKQKLEERAGVFVRQQKLIFKGKGQPCAASKTTQQQRHAPPAAAAPPGRGNSSSSSSLLAHKMADMAAARAAAANSASAKAAAGSMTDRRAAWMKTGIIALRDMQLTAVQPEWVQGMSTARAADFSHNRLCALPESVWQLSSLVSLKLAHNCLQDTGLAWQELCASLSNLTSLQLGHNQLKVLPASLSLLTGLVQLDLQHNSLQRVEPTAFEGLAKLEVLQLQNNQLQQLPDSLGSCINLVALNASNNCLHSLPDSCCLLQKLQVLAVDSNRLAALPSQLLAGCSALATLSAHHNPITVEYLRAAAGYADYEARRQARASKQIGGRVMADLDKAFSEGADVQQWQRWSAGPTGLGSDGSGRAGQK